VRDRARLALGVVVISLVLYSCWGNARATPWASRLYLFGGRGLDGGAAGSLHVAVDDDEAGERSVVITGVDDDDATTVAEGLSIPPVPAWSPGGDRVAFAVEAGDERILQVRSTGGGDAVQLVRTTREANAVTHLAWSADGSAVAFVADLDGEGIHAAWVVPATGGAPRRMGPDPVAIERCFDVEPRRCGPDLTGDALGLAWLPDGGLVVLSEIMPGDSAVGPDHPTTRVVAVSPGGGPPRLLVEVDGGLDQVAASPDGRYVLYGQAYGDAHVLDTTTGRSRRLANRIATPGWSADGERLLFVNNDQVMAARADGGDAEGLTGGGFLVGPGDEPGVFGPVRPRASAWSPDRRHVAFTTREGHVTSVYLMNADGTGQTVVHHTDGDVVALRWSP
jgi:dipeptidyl aminopeptidase/acylaminoacyl peptidase